MVQYAMSGGQLRIPEKFPDLCSQQYCYCTTEEMANEWTFAGLRGDVNFIYGPYDHFGSRWPQGVMPVAAGAQNATIAGTTADTMGTCGGNCTTQADCSAEGVAGCGCLATSETVGSSLSDVVYTAACQVSSNVGVDTIGGAGGRIKRQREHIACPCNVTYVSQACCDAADGRVWESPEAKLGVLMPQ